MSLLLFRQHFFMRQKVKKKWPSEQVSLKNVHFPSLKGWAAVKVERPVDKNEKQTVLIQSRELGSANWWVAQRVDAAVVGRGTCCCVGDHWHMEGVSGAGSFQDMLITRHPQPGDSPNLLLGAGLPAVAQSKPCDSLEARNYLSKDGHSPLQQQ